MALLPRDPETPLIVMASGGVGSCAALFAVLSSPQRYADVRLVHATSPRLFGVEPCRRRLACAETIARQGRRDDGWPLATWRDDRWRSWLIVADLDRGVASKRDDTGRSKLATLARELLQGSPPNAVLVWGPGAASWLPRDIAARSATPGIEDGSWRVRALYWLWQAERRASRLSNDTACTEPIASGGAMLTSWPAVGDIACSCDFSTATEFPRALKFSASRAAASGRGAAKKRKKGDVSAAGRSAPFPTMCVAGCAGCAPYREALVLLQQRRPFVRFGAAADDVVTGERPRDVRNWTDVARTVPAEERRKRRLGAQFMIELERKLESKRRQKQRKRDVAAAAALELSVSTTTSPDASDDDDAEEDEDASSLSDESSGSSDSASSEQDDDDDSVAAASDGDDDSAAEDVEPDEEPFEDDEEPEPSDDEDALGDGDDDDEGGGPRAGAKRRRGAGKGGDLLDDI